MLKVRGTIRITGKMCSLLMKLWMFITNTGNYCAWKIAPTIVLIFIVFRSRGLRVWKLTIRSWFRFPELSQFKTWNRSGTASTQPREDNWQLIGWEVGETLLDLELNANHLIPSYCHLPVIWKILVNRCGSLVGCKPQTYF